MRLLSIYIEEYKNLKDFSLNFNGDNFIDLFVGKNGSGKSNFFEALIEIFRHLDQSGNSDNKIDFCYRLTYEIDKTITEIEWKNNHLRINNEKDRKSLGKTPFPDNVLIYYSGHNHTITNLVKTYENAFRSRIKGANLGDSRRFIGIGPEYKSLLLTVLLSQPNTNKATQIIKKKLEINTVANEFILELKQPKFADGRLMQLNVDSIDPFDIRTQFWGTDGITRTFIDKLRACIKGEFKHDDIYKRDKNTYRMIVNLNLFQKVFENESLSEIFRQFDNLKTLEMLSDISIAIQLNDGTDATINYFSDGQFQSVYIYSITELFKDRNCITLLDEPDSFLHPEWQYAFLKQIFEITDTASKNNHVLMSSHSAVTLIQYDRKCINLFITQKGKIVCQSTSKDYAISKLSSNLINYREDEQILSILRNIRIESAPVLLTEGSTDPDIIKIAWKNLYDKPLPFIPIYAFCCDYLKRALQDNRIINEMNKRPLFGLFDFDEAYNEWNHLNQKATWTLQSDDPYQGLRTENPTDNVYAFLLPVPRIPKIEAQVMKDPGSKDHFAQEAVMSIEHLFYCDQTKQYFETKKLPGGGEVINFSGNKTKFAKEVVPTLHAECFEVLRPMFDFIISKLK